MQLELMINGAKVSAEVLERKGASLKLMLHGKPYYFMCSTQADGTMLLDCEVAPNVWRRVRGAAWAQKGVQHIQLGGHDFTVSDASQMSASVEVSAPLSPRAPMPGLVRQVLVKKGEKVKAGQPLAVLEAMKLQLTLAAGGDGTVEAVLVKEGDMVPESAELVRVKP